MKNRKLKCIISGLLLMAVVGCGAKTPAEEAPEAADSRQEQEAGQQEQGQQEQAADQSADATAEQTEGAEEDSAGDSADAKIGGEDDLKISDEDFYAEILDRHYYEMVNQLEFDTYYSPAAMMSYAYSKDGYDKAGALDYSGYGFTDLDGDGLNELIIGNLSDDPKLDKVIYIICTRHNNVPCGVLSSTETTNYYLCTGNLIGYEKHSSPWYNGGGLYEFTSDTLGTTFVIGVESKKGDDNRRIWTKTKDSGYEFTVTEEDAEKLLDEYRGRRITPELTAFSKYEPRNPEEYYDNNAYSTYGKGYKSWNEGYLAYLDEMSPENLNDVSYALIYVDDDDVPELVIDTGFEAGGCQILSYYDGTVRELQTSRLYFTYIEKSGLLCNSDGHMGYYYDYVFRLDKGQWKTALAGDYYELDENASEDQMYNDETGRFRTINYEIDGEPTDEQTYMERLKAVYDLDQAKEPLSYLRIDDLRSYLETGKYVSDDHRYELFVDDCSWEQAQKICKMKGGYLACLTTDEEFEKVNELIKAEGKENIVFYIGANRVDKFGYQWIDPNLTQSECTGSGYWKHWLERNPSYRENLSDGTEIAEEYVEYFYRKSEDKFYMNDVPNDVIHYYPSFRGRMGFICEYD